MARPVELKVYDLSSGLAKSLSLALIGKQIEGIWHTGVVVGGTEYFFGQGIQQCPQHLSPFGTPLQNILMGNTEIPDDMIRDYIEDVGPRFNAATYDLLSNNCNTFSDSLCDFLVGKNIPDHILGLPEEVMESPGGRSLLQMIQPALQQRFSSVTSAGLMPSRGATQATQRSSTAASAPCASSSDQETLPSNGVRASEYCAQGVPGSSLLEQMPPGQHKQEYKDALYREFQNAQQRGIQDANAAAVAAIRRVTELVQSGVVMPPELDSMGGAVTVAKQ